MRKILLMAVCLLAFARAVVAEVNDGEAFKGKISISGAWALYPMVVKWAEDYRKLHPDVVIDISAGGAGKGMVDALSQAVDLGMVSREINPTEKDKGAWHIAVVKDAVVVTVNAGNPLAAELMKKGLKKSECEKIWVSGEMKTWNGIVKADKEYPLHAYTRSDACGAAETWAKYMGCKQEDINVTAVYGDPGVAEAVRKDEFGIGYNNISFAYSDKTKKPVKGLFVVPLDQDGDGKISKEEDFYGDLGSITEAIAQGRYPSPPARDLNLVSKGKPSRKVVQEFLSWVLNDGQKSVAEAGYISLSSEKLEEARGKLKGGESKK